MVRESELDDDQLRVLNSIIDKSLIVTGCAGSGKSVLALIKAARIEKERGKNYQIIVYTKALCSYMNSGRIELGLKNMFHYHWYWQNKLGKPSADYTIVDEIQDFTKEEIEEFIGSTKKNFFFFGDTAQSIYEGLKDTMPVEDIALELRSYRPKQFELYRNYRLPMAIAKFVQYIGKDLPPFEPSVYKSKVDTIPFMLRFKDAGEQLIFIKSMIERYSLTDVAVLLPNNELVKDFAQDLSEIGIDCELKYNNRQDWRYNEDTLNFSTTNVKVMTYHSAKGLQFETVFLPIMEKFKEEGDSDRKSLYVAATRTYKDLYLMYSEQMPSVLKNIPAELFKTDTMITIEDI